MFGFDRSQKTDNGDGVEEVRAFVEYKTRLGTGTLQEFGSTVAFGTLPTARQSKGIMVPLVLLQREAMSPGFESPRQRAPQVLTSVGMRSVTESRFDSAQ